MHFIQMYPGFCKLDTSSHARWLRSDFQLVNQSAHQPIKFRGPGFDGSYFFVGKFSYLHSLRCITSTCHRITVPNPNLHKLSRTSMFYKNVFAKIYLKKICFNEILQYKKGKYIFIQIQNSSIRVKTIIGKYFNL